MANEFKKIEEKMGKDEKMDDLFQYRIGIYLKNHMNILNIKVIITGYYKPIGSV